MSAPDPEHAVGPYARAALEYHGAGWAGILPLPPRAKANPPHGYTGADATDPSFADVYTWVEGPEGAGNIGLRLPPHVIGIDVDAYEGKAGLDTIAAAIREHGPMPPSWRTTSRDDGISGIYLFRVPEGLRWPGMIGPGVEIIQTRHRYAVVAPSIHPNGGTYRWIDPSGVPAIGAYPDPDALPYLPDTWVGGLTAGELATDTPRAGLTHAAATTWMNEHGAGQPCQTVTRTLNRYLADLGGGAARHDVALAGTARLAHLAAAGHVGATTALTTLGVAFTTAILDRTDQTGARTEWANMVLGAADLAAVATVPDADPCDHPFAELIGRPPLAGQLAAHPAGGATPAVYEIVTDPAAPNLEPDTPRSSWWPRDLTRALTGEQTEPPPTFLSRLDGKPLIYPGLINGLIGESESGKTWIALEAVRQALTDGHPVTYLDFESTASAVVGRFVNLGLDAATLDGLTYIAPEEGLNLDALADLTETLHDHHPELVILDGFNAAMTLLGYDLNSNTDATLFAQHLLNRIVRTTTAGLLYVDHVPKNREHRGKGGIGAQAKRAMTTGTALRVEVLATFGRGQTGRLRLTVDKDRPGYVRELAIGGDLIGTATLASDATTGDVTITIAAPHGGRADPAALLAPGHTETLTAVSAAIAATGSSGASRTGIREAVGGGHGPREAAIDALLASGHIAQVDPLPGSAHGQRHSRLVTVRPYEPEGTP